MAAARTIGADELVLDGEVLALRSDGRPEAFQLVASRTATHTNDAQGLGLRVFFFDVLHVDGRTLLDVGLTERAAELERLLPPELRVERTTVTTVEELDRASSTRRWLVGSRAWW